MTSIRVSMVFLPTRLHAVRQQKGILTLLPARLLHLGRLSVSHQPVSRLEFLHRLVGVVDEREAGALATTILRAEAEDRDLVLGRLVELAEFAPQLVLADVCAAGVEDVTVNPIACQSMALVACMGTVHFRDRWKASVGADKLVQECDTHTTICLRPRSGLRMNLRVRRVTWPSDMIAADC